MKFSGNSREEPVEQRNGVWSSGIQAKCIAGMTRVTKFVTRIRTIRMYCDTLVWAMIFVECFGVWSWGIQAKCIAGMTSVTEFVTRIWTRGLGFWNFFKELWRARCVEKIKNASIWYLDAHMSRWPTTQR